MLQVQYLQVILTMPNIFCWFVFVFGEGLSLCQLGLCAEDGFVFVLNERRELRFCPRVIGRIAVVATHHDSI